jgi:hypothetical protein
MRKSYNFIDVWFHYIKSRCPVKETDKWEYEVDKKGISWMHHYYPWSKKKVGSYIVPPFLVKFKNEE